jgi:hypothetical protein
MVLRFYGPFLKMAEPEADIALLEPVPLRELIRILANRYPALRSYAAYETDEALGAHAAFVAHGRVLKLSDPVDDSDEVNVLLPMVGG